MKERESKRVLFLVTELQRPVGGLHRFTTELLPVWMNRFNRGETLFEPLVFSIRDQDLPLGDLKPSERFNELAKKNGVKIYEAKRGGVLCFFVESELSTEERNALHYGLWAKYGVKSEKSSNWPFYKKLNAYWKTMPAIAEQLAKKENITVIDAQDWLAFPAGFLCRERIGKPLVCRFHSGEWGRSMGHPDLDDAPVRIEAAALQEADFVVGVSVSEAKFEIRKLLPLKQETRNQLFEDLCNSVGEEKAKKWFEEQLWKEEKYEEFLLLEPEEEFISITHAAGGVPNGIILEDWRKMSVEKIKFGRVVLQKLLPDKKKYVMFIGRPDARKGMDQLINAFAQLEMDNAGLILSSSLSNGESIKYNRMLEELGLKKNAIIYSGWLEEDLKKSLFCSIDVLAIPSLYEPFGLVTLEGLAADLACEVNDLPGPAVVVGDTGGMGEVIKNGINGFKVQVTDFTLKPEDLAKVLKIVLTNDRLRKKVAKGGAESIISNNFDWNSLVFRLFEIYTGASENYGFWRENSDLVIV
ncbi:glycosyltransferase family 4 protein [Candidatus Micrarchaeota archaeon]|nr:glycosyltransferase family 4 protein [Candidatus Micrarchaeota archaeon]